MVKPAIGGILVLMVIPYVFIVATIKFDEAYVLTYEQFKEIYDKEGIGIYEYKCKFNYADIKSKDLNFYNQITNYGKKERMSIPDELAQAQLERERKERNREYQFNKEFNKWAARNNYRRK